VKGAIPRQETPKATWGEQKSANETEVWSWLQIRRRRGSRPPSTSNSRADASNQRLPLANGPSVKRLGWPRSCWPWKPMRRSPELHDETQS